MPETPEQRVTVRRHATRRAFMVGALRALTPAGTTFDYDRIEASRFFVLEARSIYRQLFEARHPPEDAPPSMIQRSSVVEHLDETCAFPGGAEAIAGALRALTPGGTLADLHAGRGCFWPREARGALMWMLLQDERPDLRPWARDWNALEHELLVIPRAFVRALEDEQVLSLGGRRPARPVGDAKEWLLEWSSNVTLKAAQIGLHGALVRVLLSLADSATGKHEHRRYFPLVRQVRSAVSRGARLLRAPEPVELDEDAMRRLPSAFDTTLDALTLEDLVLLFSLVGPMLRNRLVELEDVTLPPRGGLSDPDLIGDAVAASFPMWDERLEREVLPLTPQRFATIAGQCDRVEASPGEIERTRAMAWRRLAKLCVDPVPDDVLEWLDRLTSALEARGGVGDLTTLIVGLDVYCAGFPDHGTRIWRTHEDIPS